MRVRHAEAATVADQIWTMLKSCLWALWAAACAAVMNAGMVVSEESPSPPPPVPSCPSQCGYDAHFKGCGVRTTFANGSSGFICPKALLFSVGFDSDMVLQRSPAKSAVYGQMVGDGHSASVTVTVSRYASSPVALRLLLT